MFFTNAWVNPCVTFKTLASTSVFSIGVTKRLLFFVSTFKPGIISTFNVPLGPSTVTRVPSVLILTPGGISIGFLAIRAITSPLNNAQFKLSGLNKELHHLHPAGGLVDQLKFPLKWKGSQSPGHQ